MRFLALALILSGCSAKKPISQIPPGMKVIGNFVCLIEARDAKTGKVTLMTCDDGKGEKQTWRAQ